MKKNYALTAFYAGVMAMAIPAFAYGQTIEEGVRNALATHPAVAVAKARQDSALEDENEQRANLFPTLNATATGGRMFADNSTTRGLVTERGEAYSWLWEGSASLTQPLFNGFQTYNRMDAAKAREQAAGLTLVDTRAGIALRAVQAHLNVLRARGALDITTRYEKTAKDYRQRIAAMVESGAADAAELAQAKNIHAMVQNTTAEMEGQLAAAMADYAEVTGTPPSATLKPPSPLEGTDPPVTPEDMQKIIAAHPIVQSAERQLEAESQEVDAEIGGLFPTLDGELSTLKRDQKEEIGGELVDNRAVVRMNWSLQTGGAQIARIRKSKAERSEALAREGQTRRQIERDIHKAVSELKTAQTQKKLNDERRLIAQDLLKTYKNQFEASRVRLLQLLQAENQLFMTELEHNNANFRLSMANYGLLAAKGRLLTALEIDETHDIAANAKWETP